MTETASASAAADLNAFLDGQKFGCVLADPFAADPAGKPLAQRFEEICALPVADHMEDRAHCYLWVPNARLPEGMKVLQSWGFKYTSNIVWQKSASDEAQLQIDDGEVFADTTALLLFGIRGKNVRTLAPARSTVNFIPPAAVGETGASGKPDAQYHIIERCSWGPFLELFGHGARDGWTVWP